jgi:hypothetical protein
MGREAICKCDWAGTIANVKVLLETTEIIVRGEIRKRVRLTELEEVEAQAGRLSFNAGGERVQLFLGADQASKWAKALTAPPPTLARKLGITDKTTVRSIGSLGDEALTAALAEGAQIPAKSPDLIVASVETPKDLDAALKKAESLRAKRVPIWLVYPKGAGHALNESLVRSALLAKGLVDTKVASVSERLTAIRFNPRRTR